MRRLPALFAFSLTFAASSLALADEPPPERDKKKDESKKGGCSIADEGDAMIGLAGLALLLSGLALRRRD